MNKSFPLKAICSPCEKQKMNGLKLLQGWQASMDAYISSNRKDWEKLTNS